VIVLDDRGPDPIQSLIVFFVAVVMILGMLAALLFLLFT
jgi:hypothetical protein